jgi:uncharacterized protein
MQYPDRYNQQPDKVPAPVTVFNRVPVHPVMYGIFVLLIIFFLYQIVGGGLTVLMFGLDFSDDTISGIRWVTLGGQVLLLLIPTLLLLKMQSGHIRGFIRLKPIGLTECLLIAVGVIALQQFLQGYMVIQDQLPLPEAIKPFVENMRQSIERMYRILVASDSVPELLFVILVVALVPAISEEVLFRGLVQRNFEFSFGLAGGGIAAGIIFGLYHLNPFSLVPLMVLGILFGLLVYKTGSILSAMVAHFVNNLTAILAVYIRGADSFVASEGNSITLSLLLVMFVSLLIATMCWFALGRIVAQKRIRANY